VTVQPLARPGGAETPPVNPGAALKRPGSAEILATSTQYIAEQQAATAAMIASVLAAWATIETGKAIASWKSGIGEKIYVLVSMLQELMARHSNTYVRQVMALQGLTYTGPDLDPLKFAGRASDGRDLESLLAGAVVALRRAEREGRPPAEGSRRGADWLRMVTQTQAADAAREAEQVSIVVAGPRDQNGKDVALGWIRVLNPPSCGRCVALAGKFFRWNEGFYRHPNCDCRHIGVSEANASDILTDPMIYFNSLTEAEQNRYFGGPQAQAVRDGAAIDRVINAQRGGATYIADGGRYTMELARKNGGYGYRSEQSRRPTPYQIYQEADGDQDKAIELLRRFGYITGGPAR
jgi:hypothetical protein